MQGIDALALKPYFDTNIDCICQNMKFEKKILEWAKLNRAWSHEWKNLHTRAKQSAGNDSVASKNPIVTPISTIFAKTWHLRFFHEREKLNKAWSHSKKLIFRGKQSPGTDSVASKTPTLTPISTILAKIQNYKIFPLSRLAWPIRHDA